MKVPWNESSWERKFHVTFAVGNESSREQKFPGAKVRGNESSIIPAKYTFRKFRILQSTPSHLQVKQVQVIIIMQFFVTYNVNWNNY